MPSEPMTAAQIVEALCLEAEWCGTYFGIVPEKYEAARARRDEIKAALVEWIADNKKSYECENIDCADCAAWRKLEEACRGK